MKLEEESEWSFSNLTLSLNQFINIAFGARINGFVGDMDDLVELSLKKAAMGSM